MSSASSSKKGQKFRKSKEKEQFDPGSWECTVCTFRNEREAFKCQICDTRKGTSTRKPRLNPVVVQQQTLVQNLAVQNSLNEKLQLQKRQRSVEFGEFPNQFIRSQHNKMSSRMMRRRPNPFRESLVVRSTVKKRPITVNGVTFTITEFKPRISPRGRKKLLLSK